MTMTMRRVRACTRLVIVQMPLLYGQRRLEVPRTGCEQLELIA
jgi:hypothetical protein